MFKNWFSKVNESFTKDEKNKKKLPWILALGFLGIILLVVPSLRVEKEVEQEPLKSANSQNVSETKLAGDTSIQYYENKYSIGLATLLSRIVGVNEVSVQVYVDSSEEEVFATDERETEQVTKETDKRGGNRSVTQSSNDKKIAYYRTESGDKPIIVKRVKPRISGVFVVARGVENLQVRAIVIEAIQRALDVPSHRISVLPRKPS